MVLEQSKFWMISQKNGFWVQNWIIYSLGESTTNCVNCPELYEIDTLRDEWGVQAV